MSSATSSKGKASATAAPAAHQVPPPVAAILSNLQQAQAHYAEHAERPFFGELVDFITSGPIVAMVLEGVDAVKAALA